MSASPAWPGFPVQRRMCSTCIYRPESGFDIERLEAECRDPHVGFAGFRECHHAKRGSGICCRGFWERHKDAFPAGQIAQRLGLVILVDVDVLDG